MSTLEHFHLSVGVGFVEGTLRDPGGASRRPVVLVCGDPPGSTLDHGALLDAVGEELAESGIASAQFAARREDPAALADAATLIDDAEAVLGWLAARPELDATRLGVLGCCLGAVLAAGIAARHEAARFVCLLAPVTGEDAQQRLEKPNGLPTLLDPLNVPRAFVSTLAALTPVEDLTRQPRSVLIVSAAGDRIVPARNVLPIADAIERAGRPVQHELIAHASHEFTSVEARAVCVARIAQFFLELKVAAVAA